jgi:iron complex outermembrane receptor protein
VRRIPGRIHRSSMAFLVAAVFTYSGAQAQILVHFDLPAQSLARSLKAIGTATNTDVGFSANQVAGIMAPSLKAELTVDGALMRVLAGTGLRAQHLDDHTVVIAPTGSLTSNSSEITPSQANAALEEPPDSAHAMNVVDISSSPVLAHADTAFPESTTNSDSKDSGSPTDQLQEVTVTGSHIRGVTPSSPVIQIGRGEIDRSGYVTVADIMRTLPQNFAGGTSPQTATGAAPGGANNGSFGGGSAPNLRGLGASSTLTLIDGHRLAQDTDTGAVDITAVPLDAIERIAVITDGSSAAYGSDAVAGVVNIILRAPYDGAKATISSGYATDGGGLDKRASLLMGKTWDGGGALVTYEHEAQDSVLASQRNFTSTVYAPYTLLPSTNRNSYFLSGRQNLSSGLAGSFEGFYTSRGAKFFSTEAPGASFDVPSAVQSYGGTGELRAALPLGWVASLDGTFGNQRTGSPVYMLNAFGPGSIFYYAENITGSMRTVEISADGPLFRAPGGTARLAIGGGHRREGFGDVVVFPGAPNSPVGSGSRSVSYGFGELAMPLIAPRGDGHAGSLDFNVSGRLEHYSDFGQTAVPKLGLRSYLTQTLTLRGDWGRSFHAPTLYQFYAPPAIALESEPDPSSSTGVSPNLVRSGGNSGLRPERATTWTLGADYRPAWLPEGQLIATYFNIAYRDRISQLANGPAALIDPIYAPFVTRSPSPALQQALINQAGVLNNYTGAPYDPASVAAVIDFRNVNISRQNIEGLDLLLEKKSHLSVFDVDEFFNGTYMQLRNQITNSAPEQELAGTIFNPPRVRIRSGATVVRNGWSGTGTVNYSGRESNNLATGSRDVPSWTTIDAQLAYVVPEGGLLSGFRASLSAINLLDRSPPYLEYNAFRSGFNYDVANATPLGRFITLQLQMNW